MSRAYDHKKIEQKWQKRWADEQLYKAADDSKKEKLYVLDMYPYPSGAGLHVGHVEGYTATDIYSRFKRMQGFEVLHPMGWDAFGLPAENYAIKTGIPPAQTTNDAIDNFRSQMQKLGFSYDWGREVGSHTPEYYKWTQWFFLFLYNNGLAEKRKAKVNWCPKDQTVLANEQVVDGKCERCGTEVVQKDLEQWFFKITEFADALHDDLDTVDWPESTKAAQRNWIGRSEGAEIEFAIVGSSEKIKVFTTRPDTLFGATYMVLAPEHPLLLTLKDKIENWDSEVLPYMEVTKNKTELERQEEGKEKTGVELKGIKAINPANKEAIPVFIADYVLGTYGTGAIMAVPAHDERDYAFAKKFGLPIKQVIMPSLVDTTNPPQMGKEDTFRKMILAVVRNPKNNTYLTLKWKNQPWTAFVTGGVEEGEDPIEAAKREIAEETGYTHVRLVRSLLKTEAFFFAAHKNVNRKVHGEHFLFELEDETQEEVSEEETGQHEPQWLTAEELQNTKVQHVEFPLLWERIQEGMDFYVGPGVLTGSGKFDGVSSEEARQKIAEYVGGKMVTTYRLRDWLISRQRYWGAPIPVVYDPEGKPHPIPEEHLPWLLPTDVEFKPTGTSPLSQSKELLERTEKIFGKGWKPEVDTMDTFVCSSWYYFRFADPHNTEEFAAKDKIREWLPVDLYVGGAEHTVLHLLYARFFTKALQKHGHVAFSEPFQKLRHQGTILAADRSKMSKSKGNVVNPDDVMAQYGADSMRLYEMFMGPLEVAKPWDTKGIMGVRRFLERTWRAQELVQDESVSALDVVLNQTIKKVGEGIEALKFNTAISQMMILLNAIEAEKAIGTAQWEMFLRLLAPFAPHMANELAEQTGRDLSVWPSYDEDKTVAATVSVAVQVNGKVRGSIELTTGATKEEALAAARKESSVAKWLAQGEETKAMYVPGKIISFVIKPK